VDDLHLAICIADLGLGRNATGNAQGGERPVIFIEGTQRANSTLFQIDVILLDSNI
jgi:hypothetical protein